MVYYLLKSVIKIYKLLKNNIFSQMVYFIMQSKEWAAVNIGGDINDYTECTGFHCLKVGPPAWI